MLHLHHVVLEGAQRAESQMRFDMNHFEMEILGFDVVSQVSYRDRDSVLFVPSVLLRVESLEPNGRRRVQYNTDFNREKLFWDIEPSIEVS